MQTIFKNCAPFTGCISEIINTQSHNAKALDAVILVYNFLKNSDNYVKKSGRLLQYFRDEQANDLINSK